MSTSGTTVVGYSGVTASGAGFTGTAPVAAGPAAVAGSGGYESTIRGDALQYAGVTDAPVTAREVVFTDDQGELFIAPTDDELSRYAYEWDIGPASDLVTAESAMSIMKESPNVVFPFEVNGRRGERTIQLESVYSLDNVRLPGDRNNPVQVVQSAPTSFTFLTLAGHFRGAGRTIRFATEVRNGRLVLRQEGTSAAGIVDEAIDAGARIAWRYQADNLRAAIFGGQRADFPGSFPISW